jgi:hypothetical protein
MRTWREECAGNYLAVKLIIYVGLLQLWITQVRRVYITLGRAFEYLEMIRYDILYSFQSHLMMWMNIRAYEGEGVSYSIL